MVLVFGHQFQHGLQVWAVVDRKGGGLGGRALFLGQAKTGFVDPLLNRFDVVDGRSINLSSGCRSWLALLWALAYNLKEKFMKRVNCNLFSP